MPAASLAVTELHSTDSWAHDPLRATAEAWLAAGRAAQLVQVLSSRGSVPREAGTRMLVAADAVAGTIGGGHLEWQAIAHARERLHGGLAEPDDRHIVLGPTLGQCCGGALTLRTEALTPHSLERWPATAARFWLQMHGAGHVGSAIASLLAGIACRVQWVDERDDAFASELALPPHIERLCIEPAAAEVAQAPAGAYFLVLTHSHALDERITDAVLRRGDFGYLGLIGSSSKRARFVHRFEQRGIRAQDLARLTCPIGVAGVAGKEPEVIAVAVVAQLLQASASRSSAVISSTRTV
ncbi:MAG: xanthine dehydrogenase accessory protein XdhC [Burkholderiaceae bacterium]|nr:xanthine dehydrogenase accessory protein XdhC [Burkholderiaceae bacterium]